MGKATQDLRKEHESILYVLEILDKMMLSDRYASDVLFGYYGELLYFLKTFADKCHHGKEENFLFKELVVRGVPDEGGPVGAMLNEHAQGRQFIVLMEHGLAKGELDEFTDAARSYRNLLIRHIDKENGVLFVLADRIIDDGSQDLMFERFEEFEETVMGHGVHEKLHGMLDAWAEAFDPELHD